MERNFHTIIEIKNISNSTEGNELKEVIFTIDNSILCNKWNILQAPIQPKERPSDYGSIKHKKNTQYDKVFNGLAEELSNKYQLLGREEILDLIHKAKARKSKYNEKALYNLCYVLDIIHKVKIKKLINIKGPTLNYGIFDKEIHVEYMRDYKTVKCNDICESKINCFKYHTLNDRRRKPILYKNGAWNYNPVLCKQKCNKEECEWSHTQFEVDYHPLNYKTQMCEYEEVEDICLSFGSRCSYAHNKDFRDIERIITQVLSVDDNELVLCDSINAEVGFDIDLFKTIKCNKEHCTDYFHCLGYHNALERRRNVKNFYYEAIMCSHTFIDGKYKDPKDCINKDNCLYCHTKNEYYYHPKNFRIKHCQRRKCSYGKYCPDIHLVSSLPANDYAILEQKYKELEKQLKDRRELAVIASKYWTCNKCKQLLKGNIYFLKDCKDKLCLDCRGNDTKCSVCNVKIEHEITVKLTPKENTSISLNKAT